MKPALRVVLLVLGVVILLTPASFGVPEPSPDPWAPIRYLLGEWEGADIGKEDSSRIVQEYRFALGGKFVRSATHAEFDPAEAGVEPEVHEDVGYLSFDADRGLIIFRQFHSEGFVNTYALERATEDSLIFVSESTEGSSGSRVRLRYWLSGADEFVQELDLAPPERSYFTYKRMKMVRSSE